MHASAESEASDQNSPEERYRFWQASIQEKLSTLNQELERHELADRIHWGHVGDLAFVDSSLGNILEFFNIPRARIEE